MSLEPLSERRTAIITGASSGIGAATAHQFLRHGWQVLCLARRPASVPGVHSITLDLESNTLDETMRQICHTTLPTMLGQPAGQIALIHNAGVFMNDTVPEIQQHDIWRALQINVVAAAILNREILPLMTSGSSIIYVGSTLSEKAVANTASYVVSKHAVVGLMRASCQDLLGRRIHTACVCPGFVDTPMLRERADAATITALAKLSAYEKVLSADDVAELLFQTANMPVLNGSVIHAHYGQLEH